ncbi:DUF4396 domain-containing protein [Streptomyces sp. NBC_01244]|uniref:DUF4396 domain-containing protein n=1 Tax=Streptomyces sp. NBC_01244 TaxID=2903797 RepID=UPI002E0E0075|nr:DUF4396 domain-containing protein [Streptomyces sp. NBC_01244]
MEHAHEQQQGQQHQGHAGHEHHGHQHGRTATGGGKVTWAAAARATLHCLTGCAIGEVLGMVIGTALGWGNAPTMVLAIILAFFFGYALTLRGIRSAGLDFRTAIRVALAADTLSIAVMEVIDNGVLLLWPGAMDAMLSDALFWTALGIAFAVAFVVTTPVNKWMIGRGKGHAVVHRYHH